MMDVIFLAFPLLFVLVLKYFVCALITNKTYNRQIKQNNNAEDFRKPVFFYCLISNCLGFIFIAVFGNEKVLIANSFESFFYPFFGFVFSVGLCFLLIYYKAFRFQKAYLRNTFILLLLYSPYIFLLPIINNLFVKIGFYNGIH